jgi:hypothetical protein
MSAVEGGKPEEERYDDDKESEVAVRGPEGAWLVELQVEFCRVRPPYN